MRCMTAVRPDGELHQAVLLDGFTVACGGDHVRSQDMLSSVALFLRQRDHHMASHFHTVYQCRVLIMGEQEGEGSNHLPFTFRLLCLSMTHPTSHATVIADNLSTSHDSRLL